jgi:hypothetical protein
MCTGGVIRLPACSRTTATWAPARRETLVAGDDFCQPLDRPF